MVNEWFYFNFLAGVTLQPSPHPATPEVQLACHGNIGNSQNTAQLSNEEVPECVQEGQQDATKL